MSRPSWDETWLAVAYVVGNRSACSRAQVGAVIVNEQNRVAATGYNGPAATAPYDTSQPCRKWCTRARAFAPPADDYGLACPSIHAEANALLYVDRTACQGATLYVTHRPCPDCAKLISNSGIARIVVGDGEDNGRPDTLPYLRSCGIVTESLPNPTLHSRDT